LGKIHSSFTFSVVRHWDSHGFNLSRILQSL
jgi:hypothetical protein